MTTKSRITKTRGFTLVELLVVIAIIALLLGALLPAFAVVKRNARIAQAQSMFQSLDTGIQGYRSEQSIGASLPPSATDSPAATPQRMASPFQPVGEEIDVSGAQLLTMALMGADGLGTPGFKAAFTPTDGWWNDTFKAAPGDCKDGGLYCIKTDGKEGTPRYGPYVDEKMRARATTVKALAEKGKILNPDEAQSEVPFFTDPWDTPILYYKASPTSTLIVGDATRKGIYRQEDNGLITGTKNGRRDWKGLDFGAGTLGEPPIPDAYHPIADASVPKQTEVAPFLEVTDMSFARFIVDEKIKARITPVQKDSYLLISAGPDSRYGTADDITNWTRETN